MKKIIPILVFVCLFFSAIAQVKTNGNSAPAQNNSAVGQTKAANSASGKGGSSLGKGPKAKATAVFLGKSSGSIAVAQLSNASVLNMSDNSIPSSFRMTLSCAGNGNISYQNTQNNEITKEMKALFARSTAGCSITFDNIVVNGKPVAAITLTIN